MIKQVMNEDDDLMKEFAQLLYRDIQQYIEVHRQEFELWQLEQRKAENSNETNV